MRNITVSLSDEAYRAARIRAAERDTSVSALVREYLESLRTEEAEVHLDFPVLRSKQPGSLKITNREIDDLLA